MRRYNANSSIWQIILSMLTQKGCRYLPSMDRSSQNPIICTKAADIWDIDMLHYFKYSCNSETTVVLGEQQLFNQRSNCADPGSASGDTLLYMRFFCRFFLHVLSRSYFTSKTPNKDQKIGQLFYFLQSHNHELCSECFCACYSPELTESALCKKRYILVRLDQFPWFNCHSVALLLLYHNYKTGTKFFIEWFQSYTTSKIRNSSIPAWCFCMFLHLREVSGDLCWKCQAK